MTYKEPTVHETAFNCPSCGALCVQYWHETQLKRLAKDMTPLIITAEDLRDDTYTRGQSPEMRERMIRFGLDRAKGFPTVEEEDAYTDFHLGNVYVSRCYNCDAVAIWVYDRMIYPTLGSAPEPNGDMPSDVRADYIEAGSILNLSPRGAAALLRLALQKLCRALGKSGKDLNADIGALVRDGLDQRIQRALDAVRVIGNNAVHPGEINLKDDRPTAETLFKLLNIIVDKMISEPRQMDAIYDALPKGALEAIEKRDAKVK